MVPNENEEVVGPVLVSGIVIDFPKENVGVVPVLPVAAGVPKPNAGLGVVVGGGTCEAVVDAVPKENAVFGVVVAAAVDILVEAVEVVVVISYVKKNAIHALILDLLIHYIIHINMMQETSK